MKKVPFFFLLMVLCFSQVLKAQNASKPFVHCIVLDKTKSMLGKDGTKQGTTNIWNEVQDYCCGMVDGFLPSSTVLFYTFDKELYGPDVFEIKDEEDKTAIKNKVRNVSVDGNYTWIASNLAKVIEAVYKQYPNHNILIYLLTDGIEEQQECDIDEVIETYKGYSGDYDHLYYVDLRGLLRNSTNPCAKKIQDAFKKNDHSDIMDELATIVNLSIQHKTIYHQIEGNESKFTVSQIFEVTSGELTKDFSFEASIPDGSVKGANLRIIPSKFSIDKMRPDVEKGKYCVDFEVENSSNVSLTECQIPVQLKGCTGKNTLTIEPSSFVIQVEKKEGPKIGGEWED